MYYATSSWCRLRTAGINSMASGEDELVQVVPAAGDEPLHDEAPLVVKGEHLSRIGGVTRPTADLIHNVIPPGHAAGALRRSQENTQVDDGRGQQRQRLPGYPRREHTRRP